MVLVQHGTMNLDTVYTVVSTDYAAVLAAAAVARSAWVCVEPWPDDHCAVHVKREWASLLMDNIGAS